MSVILISFIKVGPFTIVTISMIFPIVPIDCKCNIFRVDYFTGKDDETQNLLGGGDLPGEFHWLIKQIQYHVCYILKVFNINY